MITYRLEQAKETITEAELLIKQGTIPLYEVCRALQHYAPKVVWGLETQVSDMEASLHWLEEHGFLDCVPPEPMSFSGCVRGEK